MIRRIVKLSERISLKRIGEEALFPIALILLLASGASPFIYVSTNQFSPKTTQNTPSETKEIQKEEASVVSDTSDGTSNNNNTAISKSASQVKPKSTTQSPASLSTSSSSSSPSATPSSPLSSNPSNSLPATSPTTPASIPQNPPAPESPSAIVAFYADNQSDTDAEDQNHQRVASNILASNANPIFHAGDLMEDGTQDSLDRFNSVTATLRATRTFYSALGNNDRKVNNSATPSPLFLSNFDFPNNEQWYSVNIGNLHMIVLDSAFSSTAPGSAQYNWLLSDLQSSASQSRITGVIFHHPPYPGDAKGVINTIVPLFKSYGVDFVISGHTHIYSKTQVDGIWYFVTSGQPSIGYIIARIYSDTASLTVYNNNGSIIDTVEFNER